MNVLIVCESSGTVREAFRKLGHNAWSCDTLPADDGSEYHFHGRAEDVLCNTSWIWDLLIAHPPCTYLCSSGLHWNHRVPGRLVDGKPRWANQTDSGQNRLAPSADRWKLRSKTYEGIAQAMAEQWGGKL